jgi:hypothetical protein
MKFSLAGMKKWKPVWVGIVVGLGLWARELFQRLNHNDNFLPFYTRPFVWLMQALLPEVKSPGQSPPHFYVFFVVMSFGYLLYFAVLGALLGLLFQWSLWMFRKLKRHGTAD